MKRLQKKKADITAGMTRSKLKAQVKMLDSASAEFISRIEKLEKEITKQVNMNKDLKRVHNTEYEQQEKEIAKLKCRNQLLNNTLQEVIDYNREIEQENKKMQNDLYALKNRTFLERLMNKGGMNND